MRKIKFRAWDTKNNQMYREDRPGDVFRWKNEGQPIEIMQFTGLLDRNGVEIYEGDVLKNFYRQGTLNGSVPKTEIIVIIIPNIYKDKRPYIEDNIWKYGKVIGNIYENADLVKQRII